MTSLPSPRERLHLLEGDICRLEVDVIVNAANPSLRGGGGVDGAIHRAAGPGLLRECMDRHPQGCPPGEVRLTGGHDLPARFVIHAVGPVYRGGGRGEAALLASCYRRSLSLALDEGLRTLAFPAISCGVYGYPWEEAARIALGVVLEGLADHPGLRGVWFALRPEALYRTFLRAFEEPV